MLYRILTENKNMEQVLKLVESHLDGATVIQGRGLWMGTWENSLIIETDAEYSRVEQLAKAIKELNKQDAVLIQRIKCEGFLL